MRIPRSLKPGMRTLRLRGTQADPGEGSLGGILSFAAGARTSDHEELLLGGGSPKSVSGLAAAVRSIHRYDGIRGTFRRRSEQGVDDELAELLGFSDDQATGKPLYRHPQLRIGGSAKLSFLVRR
jgi:hypothetical protein